MNSRIPILLLGLFTVCFGAEPSPRPNILFFYADDLGFGDLACYGSKVAKSPRLDRLAEEGTRFTKFYVSHCVCSPTRASAITGHFPGRHRIHGHLSFFEANRRRGMPNWLDVEAPSLPRALQTAGYRTAMIGKWHLGGGSGRRFQIKDLRNPEKPPLLEGREIVINHPEAPAVVRYGFDHARTTVGNSPTWKHAAPCPEPHEIYTYMDQEWVRWSSRAIADDTIQFLRAVAKPEKQDRPPFYINAWFKDVHTPHRPTEAMREPFSGLDPKARDHYAMVRYMDRQIGRVLDELEELNLADNTLVLFSSDNGAGKGRGGSNGPLRGWKHELYEGGIRVPLIARWPGEVPRGEVDDSSVINIVDFAPTFCRLARTTMPEGYEPDGEDIRGALRGEPFQRKKPQFWYYPSRKLSLAIQVGEWKLLCNESGESAELYNLREDMGEKRNLAETESSRLEHLRKRLLAWVKELPIATAE